MDQPEPVTVSPIPQFASSVQRMPRAALAFRWIVGVFGIVALLILAPSFRATQPATLIVLLAISIAADLWLTVELPSRRFLSLGATFTFFAFLAVGSLGAAILTVLSLLLAQGIVWARGRSLGRLQLIFTIFNAGQLALCALGAGIAAALITGESWNAPPVRWTAPLLIYSLTFLIINVTLTSIATALRYNMREVREQLWPRVSAWTALSFAICAPLALMAVALSNQIGSVSTALLTFVALISLNYILRLTLRYDRANVELTALNEISATLVAALDFGTLFPAIYRSAGKLMAVDAFWIALVDDQQREIRFSYLVEGGVELAPRTLPYGTGQLAQVLQKRQALALDAIDTISSIVPRFGRVERPSQAALIVPICAGEHLIGAISVQSHTAQAYSPRHLELLEAIGRIAAIAIRNAQLFEREKALLREREEFVSLVAHELKNPLAAISGYHQIAARRLRPDDDGLRKPLQVIAEQTERLTHLVEDLLDLSRADAGRLALNRRPTDMSKLIHDVVDQQQVQAVTHRISVHVDPNLPAPNVDPLRISQVVQNLLSNAVKYSPAGGPIDIRASVWRGDESLWPAHLRHQASRQPAWVVVAVQDRGLGIPRSELPNVFDRFFRASNTLNNEIEGVGLGLSICAELMRAHNGLIWVTSEVGEGSVFSVAIPVALTP